MPTITAISKSCLAILDPLRCSLFRLQLIAGSDNLRFITSEPSIADTIQQAFETLANLRPPLTPLAQSFLRSLHKLSSKERFHLLGCNFDRRSIERHLIERDSFCSLIRAVQRSKDIPIAFSQFKHEAESQGTNIQQERSDSNTVHRLWRPSPLPGEHSCMTEAQRTELLRLLIFELYYPVGLANELGPALHTIHSIGVDRLPCWTHWLLAEFHVRLSRSAVSLL